MADDSSHPAATHPGVPPRTAIVVGGGPAGLACARRLHEAGVRTVVLEKSRGPGGRVSTRYADTSTFDHGAQYFTVRDHRFAARVAELETRGAVAAWDAVEFERREGTFAPRGRRERRMVGVPGNNRLGQELAAGLDVRLRVRAVALEPVMPTSGWPGRTAAWRVRDDGGGVTEPAEVLVLAMPAPQAAALLETAAAADPTDAANLHDLVDRLDAVAIEPCWAVMATYDELVEVPWDTLTVRDESCPIAWIARNATKPKRTVPTGWESVVVHARSDWSREHLEMEATEAAATLHDVLRREVAEGFPLPRTLAAHRWRFARTTVPLGAPCVWSPATGVGLCGDWCLGARVEDAWISGHELGGRIVDTIA